MRCPKCKKIIVWKIGNLCPHCREIINQEDKEMGLKCKCCGADNGTTQWYGKTCKICGKKIVNYKEQVLMQIRNRFHRGICEGCNAPRLLNKLNLCADCTTIDVYAENKELLN